MNLLYSLGKSYRDDDSVNSYSTLSLHIQALHRKNIPPGNLLQSILSTQCFPQCEFPSPSHGRDIASAVSQLARVLTNPSPEYHVAAYRGGERINRIPSQHLLQKADHILTSCPTYADMRNEVLWNEAREPDYRRILSQGPAGQEGRAIHAQDPAPGPIPNSPPLPSLSQRLVGPQFACSLALIKHADPHALSPSGHRAFSTSCT